MGEIGVADSKSNLSEEGARLCFGSGWKSCPPPDPAGIREECIFAAEEGADQVLNWVHPTLDSEEKRRDAVDYVQQLVQSRLDCEVVSYGSVPLKTYLPDGDIDLTVLKCPNGSDSLAHSVLALLQDEENNENAEYQVKDTQFIDAEVKLVKCFVRNFVIDISFNQLGGLSTLCFLEQVDRLVGRDHLFKRSIILIKSWCYYESRILGAHHGLISTYALEILVLYIFHRFHSSLSGPLSALYKFLNYYSQFDWDSYCISLKGPVLKSSLPDIVVEMPEGGNNLLLSQEFLENCLDLFSVPSRGAEANPRAFQPKYINIIDPLKENNNLGRSVHIGNFYRIRSAFKFGSHKLGQVLLQPRDKVADEISKFFTNTRASHEYQYRNSIRHLSLDFADKDSFSESLSSPSESFSEENMLPKSSVSDLGNSNFLNEACYSADRVFVSGYCISAAKHTLLNSHSRNGSSESSNYSASLSDNNHFPKSKSSTENGSSESPHQFDLLAPDWSESNRGKLSGMNNTYQWCVDRVLDRVLDNVSFDSREIDTESIGGDSETFNPLADLSGDYDGNIRSLLRGQLLNGFSSVVSIRPSSPGFQNMKPWNIVHQSKPLKVNKSNNNKVSTYQTLFTCADLGLLHFDWQQKVRGTGTYIPQTNFVCMEMASNGKIKNKGNEKHLHSIQNGGCYEARRRPQGQKRRSEFRPKSSLVEGGNQQNGCVDASCRMEFGSIGDLGEGVNGSKMGVSLKPKGSTAVLMRQRVAGESIRLKNEDEFPPLE